MELYGASMGLPLEVRLSYVPVITNSSYEERLINDSKMMQITLAILKPHILKNPLAVSDIKQKIVNAGFKILNGRQVHFDDNLANRFYAEHQKKFFFNRLRTFMTSGPCEAFILEGDNAISKWRELMGPTKVFQAQFTHPNSIRGLYGLSDTRNATHGSDSPESAYREISIIFPQFPINEWKTKYK